jgi:hypothetical protein
MKSLFWIVVLLFMLIYLVSVGFAQLVSDHKLTQAEADKSFD